MLRLRQALEAINVIYTPVRPEEFPVHLSKVLMDRLPHDAAAVDVVELGSNVWKGAQSVAVTPEWKKRAAELIPTCPWVSHIRRGGKEQSFSPSDFIEPEEHRKTDLYRELFCPLGVEFQVSAKIHLAESAAAFSIFRKSPFSDGERSILKLLQPHISRAYLLNQLQARLQEEMASAESDGGLRSLTPREREVLQWIAEGKRDGEIAIILGISTRTVHKHVSNFLEKLGVETRTAAAALCRPSERDQRLSTADLLAGLAAPADGEAPRRPHPSADGAKPEPPMR